MISAQLSSTLIFVLWTSTGRARLHLNINSFDSSSHRCMTMWGMRPLRHHTVDVVPILQEQNMMWRIVNFGHHVKLWVPAKPWSYSQLDLLVIVYFLPWASLYTWKHHPSRVFLELVEYHVFMEYLSPVLGRNKVEKMGQWQWAVHLLDEALIK